MLKRLGPVLLLSLMALAGGCTEGTNEPLLLRAEALPHISSTDLWIAVQASPPAVVAARQTGPAAAEPGSRNWFKRLLYGPLHDYGETPASEPAAMPALAEVDAVGAGLPAPQARDVLQTALSEPLRDIDWLHLRNAQSFQPEAPPLPAQGSTALWVLGGYTLSADASTLTVQLRCALTPPRRPNNREPAGAFGLDQQFNDAAYRGDLSYVIRLAQGGASREENLRQWQDARNAPLLAAFAHGVQLLSSALSQDLQGQIPLSGDRKELVEGEYAPQVGDSGGAKLFRFENHSLRYYDQLVNGAPASAAKKTES